MARYDFGMRGFPQTTRPLSRRPPRGPAYDRYFRSYDDVYGAMPPDVPIPNRVTRRYNREYTDERLNAYRSYGYGDDRFDQLVDDAFYRPPYTTIGGTRTLRGAPWPREYPPGSFGPSYGGRYPDEL